MKNKTRPDIGQLVLVRHGQSDWNQKNLFTGWTDVDLTAQGRQEAQQAGRTLNKPVNSGPSPQRGQRQPRAARASDTGANRRGSSRTRPP